MAKTELSRTGEASSEIAQYQAMINSYQTKINTDSQNEENTIRGLREAKKGNVLHERVTQRDREFDDVIRELAASRPKANDAQSDYLNQIAEMAEEIEEARHEIKIQEGFVYQRTESWRVRTPHTTFWGRTPMIVDELY